VQARLQLPWVKCFLGPSWSLIIARLTKPHKTVLSQGAQERRIRSSNKGFCSRNEYLLVAMPCPHWSPHTIVHELTRSELMHEARDQSASPSFKGKLPLGKFSWAARPAYPGRRGLVFGGFRTIRQFASSRETMQIASPFRQTDKNTIPLFVHPTNATSGVSA
jgi:hypothetical protein